MPRRTTIRALPSCANACSPVSENCAKTLASYDVHGDPGASPTADGGFPGIDSLPRELTSRRLYRRYGKRVPRELTLGARFVRSLNLNLGTVPKLRCLRCQVLSNSQMPAASIAPNRASIAGAGSMLIYGASGATRYDEAFRAKCSRIE